jgi:hypothetical protein
MSSIYMKQSSTKQACCFDTINITNWWCGGGDHDGLELPPFLLLLLLGNLLTLTQPVVGRHCEPVAAFMDGADLVTAFLEFLLHRET